MANTNATAGYSTGTALIATNFDDTLHSVSATNPGYYLPPQIHTHPLTYEHKLCILAVTIAYHYGCLTKDGRILKDLAKRDYVDWQPTRMSEWHYGLILETLRLNKIPLTIDDINAHRLYYLQHIEGRSQITGNRIPSITNGQTVWILSLSLGIQFNPALTLQETDFTMDHAKYFKYCAPFRQTPVHNEEIQAFISSLSSLLLWNENVQGMWPSMEDPAGRENEDSWEAELCNILSVEIQ
jgi:hypothetical protein